MADLSLTPQEEQKKWLQEASNSVKRNAFFMKRALDEDNLREALRYSAAMLGELRTSLLTPQKYFELYMQVFDELRHLEGFFKDEHSKGRSYNDLYELVQHAGNVLPRLYLLCTVGSCFIRSQEAKAKDILKDLVELCKGVQHPTRGLFLRSYLCQVSRGLLPDTGSAYEGEGGDINDALDFLLQNFTEMNKLWVRMQHQGTVRDRDRREVERQQLADLVGKNLTYLSQLDGLDFGLYSSKVLPRVLEQIISCKDDIAQQYLMQCLIQGFPDEFHLGTLEALLSACPELQPGVKVHVIMASLMDRLARYAGGPEAAAAVAGAGAFQRLVEAAEKVAGQHADMPAADVAAIYIALVKFVGAVYPDRLDYVDAVLASCHEALVARETTEGSRAEKQLVALLSIPLDLYEVLTVLSLGNYPRLMGLLQISTRKEMAVKIVGSILKSGTQVPTVDKVEMLFDFITPLIKDVDGVVDDGDEEDFVEEQSMVARLVHHLKATDDTEEQFAIHKAAKARFAEGGRQRLAHTLPPLGFQALQLVRTVREAADAGRPVATSSKEVLQFVYGIASELAAAALQPEMALQLFLTAAYTASEEAQLETIAYEFFEQAFMLYEEDIPDSKAEVTALQSIVGTLHRCRIFAPDNRGALTHKATGYSAKLLKKVDQCRAVLACSHLYWQEAEAPAPKPDAAVAGALPAEEASPAAEDGKAAEAGEEGVEQQPAAAQQDGAAALEADAVDTEDGNTARLPPVRDADGVMVCLKRALKIANAAQRQMSVVVKAGATQPVWLYCEILNQYLYYFDQGNPNITTSVLQSLLELVANEMANDACQSDDALMAFYNNTHKHISSQKQKQGPVAEKYSGLQV